MAHILPKLERFTGLALADLNPDARFPHGPDDFSESTLSTARARLLGAKAARRGPTPRQLAGRFAAGRGHLLVMGTARDVAETMPHWIEAEAADGSDVMPPPRPNDPVTFGTQVMPLRQVRPRPRR